MEAIEDNENWKEGGHKTEARQYKDVKFKMPFLLYCEER
jgi:hypothetical protein